MYEPRLAAPLPGATRFPTGIPTRGIGLQVLVRPARRARLLLAAIVVALCAAPLAAAQERGWYGGLALGAAIAGDVDIDAGDNDWSTRCDLLINPDGLETNPGECDSQPPRTSWSNAFGGSGGMLTAASLGYRFGDWAVEGEYAFRLTDYDKRSDISILDAVTQDKQEREIQTAEGTLGKLLSHGLFGNLYWRFPAGGKIVPYLGAGIGVARISLDYGTRWQRNPDPSKITTFNDPALRARVAGTTTIGDAAHKDTVLGYQLLVGVDFPLNDRVRLDLKARWVGFGKFKGGEVEWDQLRSHDSSVGRGERILYDVSTKDVGFWAVTAGVKFAL